MKIHNSKILSAFIVMFSLIVGVYSPVNAGMQTGFPTLVKTHYLAQQASDTILLSQLLQSDINLAGPYDSNSVLFSLPADWQPSGNGEVNLSMAVSFNTTGSTAVGSDKAFGPAGTLTVDFNGVVIGVISLDKIGEISERFIIPSEAMKSKQTDGLMELRFSLNSGWSCYLDENMLLYIHTDSSVTIPHENIPSVLDLTKFPYPFFQDYSIFKNEAIVVVPDQPTPQELQGAYTIAAGLGNLSSNVINMDISTVSQLTPQLASSDNLILIGKAASALLSTTDIQLPMPIVNGSFQNGSGGVDDGIIQLVNSPWGVGKSVLVVSGNTDAGVVKAAQAVSTGVLRPNSVSNLAIVERVQSDTMPSTTPTEQTFKDLGYQAAELRDVGVNYATYTFYIPPGQTVTEDAYLELMFGNSALLQFDSSGLIVRLNSNPIGSVALTKETAAQAVNTAKISIPRTAVLTGYNRLEIRVNLIPVDRCANPNFNGMYAAIWPESRLSLPLTPSSINPIVNHNLATYPAPFAFNPTLGTTAFVLPQNSSSTWKSAFTVARYLGDRSNGPVTSMAVFYGDNIPEEERAKYNFIVFGQPTQLPVIKELNDLLPAPFADKSNIAEEPSLQVNYRITPGTNVGYVELIPSPWNEENVIIAALGNSDLGVSSAAGHLIEPLSYDLAGNFAVISGKQVVTTDTRLTAIASGVDPTTGAPAVQTISPVVDLSPTPPYRPGWVLPALIGSIVLIIVIVLVAILLAWRRSRSAKKVAVATENMPPSSENPE